MVVYLMLGTVAALAFLCVSHVIPDLAKGAHEEQNSSGHRPIRKYTFHPPSEEAK